MSGASNGGWIRLCRATVALAAAWAEFKLALDAYRECRDSETTLIPTDGGRG